MPNANIKLELKTLTPVRLAALMRVVADGLEGNPHLPAPPLAAADLRAAAVALSHAITEAHEGSRQSKLQRNDRVAQAAGDLRRVADYVRMVAQGDAVILASSGFELARPSGPPQPMGTPVMRGAHMTGRHGEVELRWSGVANRHTYHIYMTEQDPADPNCAWSLIGITGKITHRVQHLVAYRPYWFCVSAVGALGEGRQSDPVLGRAA
ncbi:MAG: fibronectin type III domain-containing protein [Flavobacteriales bacterium]|nr:fibronectin type III domain-containing protein [Flavobacteriales bacterium]